MVCRRYVAAISAVLCFVACDCVSTALAQGGSSIASASPVTFGLQNFGTAVVPAGVQCDAGGFDDAFRSWWSLGVVAGDSVTVNWQVQVGQNDARFTQIDVYPVGTNDFSLPNTNVAADGGLGTQMGQFKFNAPETGSMPLDFFAPDCASNPGPYDFTAYVQHALVLAISHFPNRARHRTGFKVAVHNPDGIAIADPNLRATFTRRVGKHWISSKTISQPFSFTQKWKRYQRGKWQYVRVQVSGPSYRTSSQTVRVKGV